MNLPKQIKQFRVQNRIKVQEIARASGLDSPTVSRIENGWKPLTYRLSEKLRNGYQRLGVSDDNLFDHIDFENFGKKRPLPYELEVGGQPNEL